MIDVSIIIVSFNTKNYTLSCIKSVLEEGSRLKKEIIVVDNGSTDGTVGEVEKIVKDKKLIKLIKNKMNLGFSKANNQGIEIAKGKYIMLLNPDTKVLKGALNELWSFAENKNDAGVVAPQLLNPNGSIQGSIYRFPTVLNALRQYWLGEKALFDKYFVKGTKPLSVEAVTMAAFLITPRALREVGSLDERYFMYFEDLDYCKRVHEKSLEVYYLPSANVVHYHGQAGVGLASNEDQWRRLIPSSKIYHGLLSHYLINFIIWSGQKFRKILK